MAHTRTGYTIAQQYSPEAERRLALQTSNTGGYDPSQFVKTTLPMDARLFHLYWYLRLTQNAENQSVLEDIIFIGNLFLWTGFVAKDSERDEKTIMSKTLPLDLHPLEVIKNELIATVYNTFEFLRSLGDAYLCLFKKTKALDKVDVAISLWRHCIGLQPDGDRVPLAESDLCNGFYAKFQATLDFEDVNNAVTHGRASLRGNYFTSLNHAQRLTAALCVRFITYNLRDDIDDCINVMRNTIEANTRTESTFEMQPFQLSLHYMIWIKCAHTADAQEAINLADECVKAARDLASKKPEDMEYQLLIAGGLARKYRRNKDKATIDDAIHVLESLLGWENLSLPQVLDILEELGRSLLLRGDTTNSLPDFDRSLKCISALIGNLSDKHSDRAMTQKGILASIHYRRFLLKFAPEDMRAVLEYSKELDANPTQNSSAGGTSIKLMTAELHHLAGEYEAAVHDYLIALKDFPRRLMLGRAYDKGRLSANARWPTVGADAAAACILCRRYCQAVEVLETSRSIGWARSSQMRSNLDKLEIDYPEYARSFQELSESLEKQERMQVSSGSSAGFDIATEFRGTQSDNLFILTKRWDALMGKIRELPGYENFLSSPKYDRLRLVSESGPVILFNISPYRSDALILTHATLDRPQIVRFPPFVNSIVAELSDDLHAGLELVEEGRMNGKQFYRIILQPILVKLWNIIIEPVRVSLRSLAPYARRIWFCPTGKLTFLPIHLVTNGLGMEMSETDLPLIPSYTITLSSLLRARSGININSVRQDGPTILAVSCDQSHGGHTSIPGAKKEIQMLKRLFPDAVTTLEASSATSSGVLSAVSTYPWLHLACHGIQAADEPYKSYFALADKPLYMHEIIFAQSQSNSSLGFKNAEFAFLSACHTARGVPLLQDEAMHLAAGLHFVGYKALIATMWSVDDHTARLLAKEVYSLLLTDLNAGPTLSHERGPQVEETAEVLWRSIQNLRKRGVPLYHLAPFIHMGI